MTVPSISEEIKKKIKQHTRLDVSKISFTDDMLLSDLGLSSLQIAEIIFSLEDDFGIVIDEEKAAEILTMDGLIKFCEEAMAESIT